MAILKRLVLPNQTPPSTLFYYPNKPLRLAVSFIVANFYLPMNNYQRFAQSCTTPSILTHIFRANNLSFPIL